MYKELTNDDLMRELDEILADDYAPYEAKQRARCVKAQTMLVEEFGGVRKVFVGQATGKLLNFAENRLILTISEEIYETGGAMTGTQRHDGVYLEVTDAAGLATVAGRVSCHCDYVVVDRNTKRVLAVTDTGMEV